MRIAVVTGNPKPATAIPLIRGALAGHEASDAYPPRK
jgi:hypothetical protein